MAEVRLATGVARVGDTVRRDPHARSAYVHAVLEHLAAAGFQGAGSPVLLSDGRIACADPRRLRLACAAYGWEDLGAGVGEIAARFERARAQHAAEGLARPAQIFGRMLAWMRRNDAALRA